VALGNVVLGLASIALGLRQLSAGVRHLGYSSNTTRSQRASRTYGGTSARSFVGTYPKGFEGQRALTPSGDIRLRTYQIRSLDQRIEHLRRLVEQGKRDPVVYEFARRAVNKKCGSRWCIPEKDNLAEIKALFDAVRQNVRYTSDIAGIDSYQSPRHTLKLRTADCDDFSSLACAAAATLGLPCRFKVIRTKGSPEWNHIYAQVGHPRRNPQRWISFDASVNMPVGWEAPKRMVDASRIFPT